MRCLSGSWERYLCVLLWLSLLLFLDPVHAPASESPASAEERLASGQVVVGLEELDRTKFVFGRIWIDEPPSRVWRILVNPFEFEGKICPRMKRVEVLVDRIDTSVLKCTVAVCWLIPSVTYVVESKYLPCGRIEFKRLSGVPRDFKGYWQAKPVAGGTRTEVTYCLYVDPGIPVPQWIMREGVKVELPRVLSGLKERVKAVYAQNNVLEPRTILAVHGSMSGPPAGQWTGTQPAVAGGEPAQKVEDPQD
ncbi:MAG TPA: SRPBCC family protein [Candidatus Obscuribacterales bacterium]